MAHFLCKSGTLAPLASLKHPSSIRNKRAVGFSLVQDGATHCYCLGASEWKEEELKPPPDLESLVLK